MCVSAGLTGKEMTRGFFSLLLLLLPLPSVCCQLSCLRNPSYIEIWSNIHKWNREDALAICRQNFTDLLTIRHAAENTWLFSYSGWIGLYRIDRNDPWLWTKGNEEARFFSWAIDKPVSGENCALKKLDSEEWDSGHCDGWDSFICSEDRVILVKEEKTWEEALAHCRALQVLYPNTAVQDSQSHHYDLVSLLSLDDFTFTREKAQGGTTDEVWTGLRFIAGHWLWVDGEPVQLGQQIPAEPTPGSLGSCGALGTRSTDSIQARDCALRKNFLCYKKFHDLRIEMT